MKFCKWYLAGCVEDAKFLTKIVWNDKATFKLNGSINPHTATIKDLHIEEHHVYLPGVILSSKGIITGPVYFHLLQQSIMLYIQENLRKRSFISSSMPPPPAHTLPS